MLATGIGIAGQLPFIKELIDGYRKYEVKTQRISLTWILERESHENWVENWMNQLLHDDEKYVRLIRY